MRRMLLTGLLVGLFCLPALAGTDYNVCFFSMDSDGDEAVSAEEFRRAFPSGAAIFKAAETNGDGVLSHDEWETYKESRGFEDAHAK